MKLMVQIPCFNEEATLPDTLRAIPREVAGVQRVEILVVDDGSTDGTAHVARRHGADYVVRHTANQGLAAAFATGIDACLKLGADVIVNTDGDNQYPGRQIPRLVAPILAGKADLVIGDRQTGTNPHFSPLKRRLQRLGSAVVSRLARVTVPDAVSGFRAMSRDAALKLNIITSFSYTIETVLQARQKGIAITSVPIETNGKTRQSRLFRSLPQFIGRSAATMLRVYAMFQPLAIFMWLSILLMLAGAVPIVRFLVLFALQGAAGHVQSLILGGVLFLCGCLTLSFGLLADLLACNRRLIETTLEKVRRLELEMARERPRQIPDEFERPCQAELSGYNKTG